MARNLQFVSLDEKIDLIGIFVLLFRKGEIIKVFVEFQVQRQVGFSFVWKGHAPKEKRK